MVGARFHPDSGSGQTPPRDAAPGHGRLNLLLSHAGWEPEPWVDQIPRLLEPMGVVSIRAGCGKQASEVLRSLPVHIAVVDLALPMDQREAAACAPEFAEGGPRLLELLARQPAPPPVVAVKRSRSRRDDARDIAAALRLGAFAVLDRPRCAADLNLVLDVLRRCLDKHYRGRWPGGHFGGFGPGLSFV